ncbi:MAG: hypothetical protein M9920_13570 [Verrucomicrobiae bacterium]|nr:hypothetical protein [Verrucomicrobiae bacterium]
MANDFTKNHACIIGLNDERSKPFSPSLSTRTIITVSASPHQQRGVMRVNLFELFRKKQQAFNLSNGKSNVKAADVKTVWLNQSVARVKFYHGNAQAKIFSNLMRESRRQPRFI